MRYTTRPISDRTPFTGEHRPSPFKVTWSTALDVLDRELYMLNAVDVVLEVDVPERAIRFDGQVRADARAATPAVRLAFGSDQGPLVYATDAFERPSWRRGMDQDWQHNVYAIALALEALRKIDRYGVTGRGQQYTGFKAIGAGTGATPLGAEPRMTETQAQQVLARMVGAFDRSEGAERFRRARAIAHPDRHNGSRVLWDEVEQAGRVLGLLR